MKTIARFLQVGSPGIYLSGFQPGSIAIVQIGRGPVTTAAALKMNIAQAGERQKFTWGTKSIRQIF